MADSEHTIDTSRPRATAKAAGGCAWILGAPIDDVTLDQAVDLVFDLADDGRRRGLTHQVATVNVDFLVNALSDQHQQSILRRTSLSVADGMPIVWAGALLGQPLRERVAGVDLVPALAARAAETRHRLALVGAGPGVAARAAALLRRTYQGLDVVDSPGPRFESVDDIDLADLVSLVDTRPDICCVAFGNPKQELFIDRFRGDLGIPVMIGVGGSLDFLTGEKRRAPEWMQSSGLEWVHRAATEPRRLVRRYGRDAARFFPALLAQAWTGRSIGESAEEVVSDAAGRFDIDLSRVGRVDNRTASVVAGSVRLARRTGRSVRLVPPPEGAQAVFGIRELFDELDGDVADDPGPP